MSRYKDLTGQKFGYWTVINITDKRTSSRGIIWHCKCNCGTEKDVDGYLLRSGQSKSCGCLHKKIVKKMMTKDIPLGTKFGKLTVIKKLDKQDNQGNYYWLCQCECGNIKEVTTNKLKQFHTISCGCLKSKGEQKIQELLENNNIQFECQKTFNDCRFLDTNYLAKFDFYVNNQYIIEFDGIQHFESKKGWNTSEHLIKTQEHDAIKNQYCFKNNIPLIRIPYTHYNDLCLEDLILETSKFLVE